MREELVERGVAHAVDLTLARGGGGRRVSVLRHHRLARRTVDVREAKHRVAGQLQVRGTEFKLRHYNRTSAELILV